MRPDDWIPTVWSHTAVMDMQARLDPVRMARYADDWQRAVDAIGDVLVEANRRVAAQLDSSWRGHGADAALDALRRYVGGSVDGLVACRSVAVRLSELSRAAGDVRACITPPDAGRLADVLERVRQLYSGPAVAAGNAVADIPAPPEPFELPDQPATVPPVAPSPGQSPPATGAPSAAAPLGSTVPPAFDSHRPAHPEPALPAAGPNPLWQAPTHSAALSASDAPSARPESPSTTPSPAMAGSSPTAPGQMPGPAARAVSQPISPFLGAAYPGHVRGDDGAEHRTPRYLISAGNTNELIGELPLVAPPVIGE